MPNSPNLRGMIVDRSSFDVEDEFSRLKGKGAPEQAQQPHSFEEDGDTVCPLNKPSKLSRTRSGKVRRKLRWKPAAFRSRKNKVSQSSAISVLSSGDRSNRTTNSFHTFHSTETPVMGNKKHQPVALERPNYPDTFEGVSTIENEGNYVHTRMNRQQVKGENMPRSQTVPETRDQLGAWEFEAIAAAWDPFTDDPYADDPFADLAPVEDHVFDPFGQRATSPKSHMLPPRYTKKPPPPPSDEQMSTPSTVATASESDFSMTSPTLARGGSIIPMASPEDYEEDRRIDMFKLDTPEKQRGPVMSGTDAAAGLAISPLKLEERNAGDTTPSPVKAPEKPPLTPKKKPSGFMKGRRPPVAPAPTPTNLVSPTSVSRDRPASSSLPVPAKVNINLDTPSNLNNMMVSSGLLNKGRGFFVGRPRATAANKRYNRPVDKSVLSNDNPSRSSEGLREASDDDSLSTKSASMPMNSQEVVIGVPGEHEEMVVQRTTSSSPNRPGRQSSRRTSTGPVDIDDGSFLEAEKNLRAIHEMAAEHLVHGEYEEALEVFEEIARGQMARYGRGHYRVGTALHNIGIVHLKSKQYEQAVDVCQAAVDVRKEALVPNHPDVAVSLAQLGVAHLECRQYREALIAFREALHIRREFLGPKHPKVGKILNNIGCALFELNELEGARIAFEEGLEIQRETLRGAGEKGSSSSSNQALLSFGSTLCNIGSIKLRWGLYEEASVALEEALLIQQSVLGDDHPTVLSTIKSIEFIDKALEGDAGDQLVYSRNTPDDVILRTDSERAADEVSSLACPAPLNFVQSIGLFVAKPRGLYQKVEEGLAATEVACSDGVDDVTYSPKRSPRRSTRRTRAEI